MFAIFMIAMLFRWQVQQRSLRGLPTTMYPNCSVHSLQNSIGYWLHSQLLCSSCVAAINKLLPDFLFRKMMHHYYSMWYLTIVLNLKIVLNDYLNCIHCHDGLRLLLNKIVDCMTIQIKISTKIYRKCDNKFMKSKHRDISWQTCIPFLLVVIFMN